MGPFWVTAAAASCLLGITQSLVANSNTYPPQLHPLVQIWSFLDPKNQDDDSHSAKFNTSKQQYTNQWRTWQRFCPLFMDFTVWYIIVCTVQKTPGSRSCCFPTLLHKGCTCMALNIMPLLIQRNTLTPRWWQIHTAFYNTVIKAGLQSHQSISRPAGPLCSHFASPVVCLLWSS